MAQAIDNSGLLNYCNNCGPTGFVPVVGFVYDAAAKTVVVTDGSTIPAGDTLKKVQVKVLSIKSGVEVRDTITVTGAPGAKTIDVTSLDASRGLNITATVITTKNIVADGSAPHIAPAGNLSAWDIQQNA